MTEAHKVTKISIKMNMKTENIKQKANSDY